MTENKTTPTLFQNLFRRSDSSSFNLLASFSFHARVLRSSSTLFSTSVFLCSAAAMHSSACSVTSVSQASSNFTLLGCSGDAFVSVLSHRQSSRNSFSLETMATILLVASRCFLPTLMTNCYKLHMPNISLKASHWKSSGSKKSLSLGSPAS